VIADAQLAATAPTDFGGAVVAFMSPGGIRADLLAGEVTYGELFTVQPFNNVMTVKTMTGDMIRRLLEQQFDNPTPEALRILQVSEGFTYSYDTTRPAGSRVSDIAIGGTPISPTASYRVAMNSFLADGGDGFTVFREGTDQLGGEIDIDALVNYFIANSPVAPGPQDRITRLGSLHRIRGWSSSHRAAISRVRSASARTPWARRGRCSCATASWLARPACAPPCWHSAPLPTTTSGAACCSSAGC
jgi:5'-nucleotidase